MEAVFQYLNDLYAEFKDPWALFGWVGQLLFSMRFIVQWLASEKMKKSVIPTAFWHLSIVGSVFLLIYGFYIKKPVYIVGYLFNCAVYLRNLHLIRMSARAEAPAD